MNISYQEWFVASVEAAVEKADLGGPFLPHDEVVRITAKRRAETPAPACLPASTPEVS